MAITFPALADLLQPSTPAANGATDTTAAPAAPVLAFQSPTASGGALDQALKIGAATHAAGTQQVMGSPLTQAYMAEKAKTDAAQAQAATGYQANMDRIAAIQATPEPDHVPIPRLKPVPVEAEMDDYQKAVHADPTRALGQFLPILAALGALTTAQPATAALNAATAAINAAKTNDREALLKAHNEWIDNTKAGIDNNANLAAEYRMALDDRNATMADRMAKVQAIAASNRDLIVLAGLKSGNVDGILKLLETTQEAGNHLQAIVTEADRNATARTVAQDESLRGWAGLAAQRYKADIDAGQTSPNQVAGQIFQKMLSGGYESLTPQEKTTLEQLKDYEVSLHPSPTAQALAGLTGSHPAPGAPPVAATPPAPAPVAAAPVTADTGAGAVVTAVAPQNPAARVANQVYGTPRGPMKWTGTGWVPPGG